jgi:hypothetical protein
MSDINDFVDNSNNEIKWHAAIKKEARGQNNVDFGEVQEIVLHYVLTEKGILNKEKFYLPTALVEGFDGDKLLFNISAEDADERFKRNDAPTAKEYEQFDRKNTLQKKRLEPKEEFRQKDENADKDLERVKQPPEDKAKMEAERKAQSIAQQIQDKAKMEAERKAQSIIHQAEEKAKVELEEVVKAETEEKAKVIKVEVEQKAIREAKEKSQIIVQQAEENARSEADRRSRELIQKAEENARSEAENNVSRILETTTNVGISTPQEENERQTNAYVEQMAFFNPYQTGFALWQNYSTIWLNITKEIINNTENG